MQNFTIEKLYTTRNIGGTTWSPDGKQIAFVSNISGRNNIWLVPSTGGWPSQLTISEQRQAHPSWSPDGNWIAYISDTDGNEQWDIFLVSPKTGEVINLTTTKEISEESPTWSPDSKQVAYTAKAKTGSSHEIELIDVYSRRVKHLTQRHAQGPHQLRTRSSRRDGKFLVYTQTDAGDKVASIFVLDLATGKSTNLTPHQGEQTFFAADISPNGKTILITSNAHNGYDNVGLLDIATQKIEWLTNDKWEIHAGAFSPDGRQRQLDRQRRRQHQHLPVRPGFPESRSLAAGRWRQCVRRQSLTVLARWHAACSTTTTAPPLRMMFGLTTSSPRRQQQVTHALVAGVRTADMVEPYLVHYPSRDGKWTISAFAYIPNNITRNGKFPAIVYIHGGPTGQFVNSFNRAVQYLVNQGYLVIAPNFRGSTGYGKEFQKANYRDEGGGDLADVVDAAEWIAKSGFVDPKKLVSMGGSYGGYMTMMARHQVPDMWGAGVPIVPYMNWFTELATEDPCHARIRHLHHGRPGGKQGALRRPLAHQLHRPHQGAHCC